MLEQCRLHRRQPAGLQPGGGRRVLGGRLRDRIAGRRPGGPSGREPVPVPGSFSRPSTPWTYPRIRRRSVRQGRPRPASSRPPSTSTSAPIVSTGRTTGDCHGDASLLKKATKRTLPAAVKLAVKAGLDKKAEDVLRPGPARARSRSPDFFVIMSGRSTRQNHAVYDAIKDVLKKKITSLGAEGLDGGEWILMDYGSFIVHIFSPRLRGTYDLEKLWGDAPRLSFAVEA